ncbi:MAG: tripartite tricarboxylate transporter substrate binding protein, partial [Bacteroidetes bacterium]|nr:tripartite tricarboxylate transporter substrate binding protein [Bacteroidota bacterium]
MKCIANLFKIGLTTSLVVSSLFMQTAWSQSIDTFPSKPIHLVVPYPAGGTTDQVARAIAQPMREILGQA